MKDKVIKEITDKLANDKQLSINQSEAITASIFRFIKDNVESGEYKVISLMHLGKFIPNKRGLKLKNNNEISKELKTDS